MPKRWLNEVSEEVYYEDIPKSELDWHMHGSIVASLAVGKTNGVAPGAKLYFIEAQWDDDRSETEGQTTYRYYAQGIHRLLDINKQLDEKDKIRVISISASPGPDYGVNDYDEYFTALTRASSEGVLLLSTEAESEIGFSYGGLQRDPIADPNDANSYYYADGIWRLWNMGDCVLFPMGSRTWASHAGEEVYTWDGLGGASLVMPYVAGLYALAVQVNPDITPNQFKKLVKDTADKIQKENGVITIANPVNLISAVEALAD